MAHGFALDRGWRALFADLGVPAERVLRRAALPDELLDADNVRLDAAAFVRFYEAVEIEVGDPLLPIVLARSALSGVFSAPVFAALCSPNLEVAAHRLSRFKELSAPVELDVARTPAGLALSLRWVDPAVPLPRFVVAAELVFLAELARVGTRLPVRPARVVSPVLPAPLGSYEALLGVRIERAAALTITFAPDDADRPFLTASDALWAVFEPDLQRRLADLESSASQATRVRAVLLEALPLRAFAIDRVARRLGVSARTLQRRLLDEGTTYNDVVRDIRRELAVHYLERTAMPSGEIALLLGFDDPKSFFRAFHAWTGRTPQSARCAASAAS